MPCQFIKIFSRSAYIAIVPDEVKCPHQLVYRIEIDNESISKFVNKKAR